MRVHLNREYVIVEKGGIPIAGMMDIDEFEDFLELHDPILMYTQAASQSCKLSHLGVNLWSFRQSQISRCALRDRLWPPLQNC
jgi:hypothetical protein